MNLQILFDSFFAAINVKESSVLLVFPIFVHDANAVAMLKAHHTFHTLPRRPPSFRPGPAQP